MRERKMTQKELDGYKRYLIREEKSGATMEKYMRDVKNFLLFTEGREMNKELVMGYKKKLVDKGYAVRSINSMLASLNSFFRFTGWEDCRVKQIKTQRQIFCPEEKQLSKEEYMRLLEAAHRRKDKRLWLMMQTICGTGIRISELSYFTVEALGKGEISVFCKGKVRYIFIPERLRELLSEYVRKQNLKEGVIFRTKTGQSIDRSNVWTEMKSLCSEADVCPSKVFPHNLRKLFARTFYEMQKDIGKLADILGHSSIDTTRIYIVTTGTEHRYQMEQMDLILQHNIDYVVNCGT